MADRTAYHREWRQRNKTAYNLYRKLWARKARKKARVNDPEYQKKRKRKNDKAYKDRNRVVVRAKNNERARANKWYKKAREQQQLVTALRVEIQPSEIMEVIDNG